MKKYLNGREQKILIICVAAVFAAVITNSLIVPLQDKKNILDQEILINQKLLDQNLAIIRKAHNVNEQYDHYVKQFSKLGTSEEAASSILSEIEQIAGKFKLRVTDLKPHKVQHNEIDNYFSFLHIVSF